MNAVKAEIDKINENITSKIITLRGEWAKKLNHEKDLAEKQEQLVLEQLVLAKKELDEAEAEYNHNVIEYFYRDNSTVTSEKSETDSSSNSVGAVETGDNTPILPFVIIGIAAAVIVAVLVYLKKKR